MSHRLPLILAAGLLALASTAALAAGNPSAGKDKSAVCAGCHGADGNAVNPIWPDLAGQHESYLRQQLQLFKSGERANAVMAGQAANLSGQDMQDLAAYYARQEPKVGEADPKLVDQGQQIYMGGDPANNLPACAACHGPAGAGNPAALYPRLGGQNAQYVAAQLKAYRSGQRAGYPAAEVMVQIAELMSDAEIEAVASYVQGLSAAPAGAN